MLQEFAKFLPQNVKDAHIKPQISTTSAQAEPAPLPKTRTQSQRRNKENKETKEIKEEKEKSVAPPKTSRRGHRERNSKQPSIYSPTQSPASAATPENDAAQKQEQKQEQVSTPPFVATTITISNFFRKLKQQFHDTLAPETARRNMEEVLKCVNLFNAEIVNKAQLIELVEPLFVDKQKDMLKLFQMLVTDAKVMALDDVVFEDEFVFL